MRDTDASTPRRPRAVPDAPVAPFAKGTGLAKAWMLELISISPLQDVGSLSTATLAQEAPPLCSVVCAAIADDAALDRLGPGGADATLAARAGAMAGAVHPAAVAAAVEALRRVTWTALLGDVRAPDARLVADLAERLAHVASVLVAASLAEDVGAHETFAGPPTGVVSLRDARGARTEPSGSWQAALERRLERHGHDGLPFALLLVELDDLQVLLTAHEADELAGAVQGLEQAIGTVVRPGDVLVRQGPGRYWITAGETDDDVARELATAIATAVRRAVTLRGTGLTVSVGIAACPRDGTTLDPLTGRAEEGVFLARASGLPVA